MEKKIILGICIVLLLFCAMETATAKTWYVDDSGGADFTKIQDAIDVATDGDIIIVSDGTYIVNNIKVDKRLTIESRNGFANCIIIQSPIPKEYGWQDEHVFEVSVDHVNIIGFTVKGTAKPNHPYSSHGPSGIYLNNASYCNISNSIASSNIVAGIFLDCSNNNVIRNNIASDNSEGIFLQHSSNNAIINNIVSSNKFSGICLCVHSVNNTVMNNIDSKGFEYLRFYDSNNNTFVNNTKGIYEITPPSLTPEIPKDYYDETAEALSPTPLEGWGWLDFKAVNKPLNEPIKIPDEITKSIIDNYEKKKINTLKISPTDFAVYISVGSTESKSVKPYLVYLDTDGDDKPEELAAVYNYPYKDTLFFDEFSNIEGHYKFIPYGYVKNQYGGFGVVINPFDALENLGGVHKLIYIENPDEVRIIDKTIPWKDAIGKTPAELGLDKDDKEIFGRTPSQTSSPAETTPSEVPTGEEKGIPGFEAIFSITGLLAVTYVLRRRDK